MFLSKWEKPKLVAGQTRMTVDTEGYRAFLRRLVAENVIKVPDPDFIQVIIERQERVVSEHQTRAPTHPGSALALPVANRLAGSREEERPSDPSAPVSCRPRAAATRQSWPSRHATGAKCRCCSRAWSTR